MYWFVLLTILSSLLHCLYYAFCLILRSLVCYFSNSYYNYVFIIGVFLMKWFPLSSLRRTASAALFSCTLCNEETKIHAIANILFNIYKKLIRYIFRK